MPFRKKFEAVAGLTLALYVVVSPAAASQGPGITSANFLEIGPGTRAAGMGEAFTAVANDAEAMAWNVAGLSQLIAREVTFMHSQWLQDVGYEFGSYAQSLGGGQGLGFSVVYLHLDSLTLVGEAPPTSPSDVAGAVPVITGENVNASEMALAGAYSLSVMPGGSAGLALKYLVEDLAGVSHSGFAADLGYLYFDRSQGWSFGSTLSNAGPNFDGASLPMTLRAGMAQRMRYSEIQQLYSNGEVEPSERRDILFSFDAAANLPEGILKAFLGTEWRMVFGWQYAALRGGYKVDFSKDGRGEPSAGLGYVLATKALEFEVDYAYMPFTDLGDTHRMSLGIRF